MLCDVIIYTDGGGTFIMMQCNHNIHVSSQTFFFQKNILLNYKYIIKYSLLYMICINLWSSILMAKGAENLKLLS